MRKKQFIEELQNRGFILHITPFEIYYKRKSIRISFFGDRCCITRTRPYLYAEFSSCEKTKNVLNLINKRKI